MTFFKSAHGCSGLNLAAAPCCCPILPAEMVQYRDNYSKQADPEHPAYAALREAAAAAAAAPAAEAAAGAGAQAGAAHHHHHHH